jgi:hypothetical protein
MKENNFSHINLISESKPESLILFTKEISLMAEIFGVYILKAE